MDFSLTHEQELIRASAREFCDREIVPHTRDWDREEDIDRALVGKLAEVGYLGATALLCAQLIRMRAPRARPASQRV